MRHCGLCGRAAAGSTGRVVAVLAPLLPSWCCGGNGDSGESVLERPHGALLAPDLSLPGSLLDRVSHSHRKMRTTSGYSNTRRYPRSSSAPRAHRRATMRKRSRLTVVHLLPLSSVMGARACALSRGQRRRRLPAGWRDQCRVWPAHSAGWPVHPRLAPRNPLRMHYDRDGRPGSGATTVVCAVGKLRQRSRISDQQRGTPFVFLTILVAALALAGTLLGLW